MDFLGFGHGKGIVCMSFFHNTPVGNAWWHVLVFANTHRCCVSMGGLLFNCQFEAQSHKWCPSRPVIDHGIVVITAVFLAFIVMGVRKVACTGKINCASQRRLFVAVFDSHATLKI